MPVKIPAEALQFREEGLGRSVQVFRYGGAAMCLALLGVLNGAG